MGSAIQSATRSSRSRERPTNSKNRLRGELLLVVLAKTMYFKQNWAPARSELQPGDRVLLFRLAMALPALRRIQPRLRSKPPRQPTLVKRRRSPSSSTTPRAKPLRRLARASSGEGPVRRTDSQGHATLKFFDAGTLHAACERRASAWPASCAYRGGDLCPQRQLTAPAGRPAPGAPEHRHRYRR